MPASVVSPVTRPFSPAKRAAILEGAARIFLSGGYHAASMDAVAAEAGVSKQTVYAHFGNKAQLFEEIVRRKCDEMLTPASVFEAGEGEPEAVLRGLGLRFLETVTDADNARFFKVVIAEGARFPEMAEAFYRAGPRLATDNLAAYLDRLHHEERGRYENPRASAEMFFALLRGDIYMRRLLDLGETPPRRDIEDYVMRMVSVFLTAHDCGAT